MHKAALGIKEQTENTTLTYDHLINFLWLICKPMVGCKHTVDLKQYIKQFIFILRHTWAHLMAESPVFILLLIFGYLAYKRSTIFTS